MFDQQQATVGKRQASGIRVSSARGAMVPVCVRLLDSGDLSLSVSGTILAKEHIPAMAPGEHVFQVFDTIAEARAIHEHQCQRNRGKSEFGPLSSGEGVVLISEPGGEKARFRIDDFRKTPSGVLTGSWEHSLADHSLCRMAQPDPADQARRIARSLSMDMSEAPVMRELLRLLAGRFPDSVILLPEQGDIDDTVGDLLDPIGASFLPSVASTRKTFRREIQHHSHDMRRFLEKTAIDMLAYGRGTMT